MVMVFRLKLLSAYDLFKNFFQLSQVLTSPFHTFNVFLELRGASDWPHQISKSAKRSSMPSKLLRYCGIVSHSHLLFAICNANAYIDIKRSWPGLKWATQLGYSITFAVESPLYHCCSINEKNCLSSCHTPRINRFQTCLYNARSKGARGFGATGTSVTLYV